MKFVIQKVSHASVTVDEQVIGKIGRGFLVLIGVAEDDTKEIADKLIKKLLGLRIFEDAITFKIALMVVQYMKYMETMDF